MKHSLIALIVATMTGLSMLPAAEAAQWRRAHDAEARPGHAGERYQERHGKRVHHKRHGRRGHGKHHGYYDHSYYRPHHRRGYPHYGYYRSPVVVLPPPPPLVFPAPVIIRGHRYSH